MKMSAKEVEKAMEFLSLSQQQKLEKLNKRRKKLQTILLIGRMVTVIYAVVWAGLLYACFQYHWSNAVFGIILIGGILVFSWLLRFFVVGIAARYSRDRDGGPSILSNSIYMTDMMIQEVLRSEDEFTKSL